MATWQFDLQFFRGAHDAPLPAAVRNQAAHVLPAWFGVSFEMLAGWFVFGAEIGNRVDLLELEDGGCEIHVRLDARRSETDAFVRDVCKMAMALGGKLFSPELGEVVEPLPSAVMDALKRSAAWRYALDPGAFINELKRP